MTSQNLGEALFSLDRPVPGVVIAQPKRGFRYGSEAFWLSGFALETGKAGPVADLGTGSGICAYLLGSVGRDVDGFDACEAWQDCWAQTQSQSTVKGTVSLTIHDVCHPLLKRYGLIVSNPPYFRADSGPISPDPWKRMARTESSASLRQFVETGIFGLGPEGSLCLVVERERLDSVMEGCKNGEGHVHRILHVGVRRTLVDIRLTRPQNLLEERIEEDDPRILHWYQSVGA